MITALFVLDRMKKQLHLINERPQILNKDRVSLLTTRPYPVPFLSRSLCTILMSYLRLDGR